MERPNAPKGWKVEEWDYRGESPADYTVDDRHTIFSLVKDNPEHYPAVWLDVIPGLPEEGTRANTLNAYRSGRYEVPHLDPHLEIVKSGIEFCIMVAEKYIDTPTEEIPGAREGYERSFQRLLELTAEKGIPATIICPDGTVQLNPKKSI